MDNDPMNKSSGEEEFSFVEDQEASKYEPSKSSSTIVAGSGGSNPRKKIFILIAIVVALFCLYKLYGLFSTTTTKVPAPSAPSVSSAPVAVAPSQSALSPPAITSPTSAPPTIEAALPPADTVPDAVVAADKDIKNVVSEETAKSEDNRQGVDSKLTQLEDAIMENGKADENLQQQIGGLTNAISGIQDNIAQLTQQLNTLSQQTKKPQPTTVTTTSQKPKTVKHTHSRHSSSVYVPSALHGMAASRATNYFVKAMIQGRAWLITSDGATFTISSGDNLPGYGQILSIDPDKGVVMTSSGRVINYMPQDR